MRLTYLQGRHGLFEVGRHTCEEGVETPVVAEMGYNDSPNSR